MSASLSAASDVVASPAGPVYRARPGQVWRRSRVFAGGDVRRVQILRVDVRPLDPSRFGFAHVVGLSGGRRSRVQILFAEAGLKGYRLERDPNRYAVFGRAEREADRVRLAGPFQAIGDSLGIDRALANLRFIHAQCRTERGAAAALPPEARALDMARAILTVEVVE